jgi:hypothetical protein
MRVALAARSDQHIALESMVGQPFASVKIGAARSVSNTARLCQF